jgi:hypothetical protein
MATNRSVPQRVSDWVTAYSAIRDEVTPPSLREVINKMFDIPTEGVDAGAYASLVQSSLHLARIVAAGDRTSAVVAAMITQSGVSRPTIGVNEE